jgi:hypothetical protein
MQSISLHRLNHVQSHNKQNTYYQLNLVPVPVHHSSPAHVLQQIRKDVLQSIEERIERMHDELMISQEVMYDFCVNLQDNYASLIHKYENLQNALIAIRKQDAGIARCLRRSIWKLRRRRKTWRRQSRNS